MRTNVVSPTQVFQALTGFGLHPWQAVYLNDLIANDVAAWPNVCSVPTGLGKSVLPLLYLIAMAYRPAPRRIVYVVNRRIVVDQTYRLAAAAGLRLRDPETIGELEQRNVVLAFKAMLFDRLGLVGGEQLEREAREAPIVHLLRGGTIDKLLQIASPVLPTIIVSTLDQAMSRLLLRGYGVPRKAWPVQAGLLAYETVWIVDEAHTCRAAVKTLRRVRTAIVESVEGATVAQPLTIVEATATPSKGAASPFFPISDDELRIANADKNVSFEWLEAAPPADGFAKSATGFVLDGLGEPSVSKIAIVVNTIGQARSVFKKLTNELEEHARTPELLLLIGAIREIDRERLYERDAVRNLAPDRSPIRPTIVVATQTIETGPDYSFDWLMTEPASIDAIVQRLGRLNRRGTSSTPRGLVYGYPEPSPIYGDAAKVTREITARWPNPARCSPLHLSKLIAEVSPATLALASTPSKMPEALFAQRVREIGRTWPITRDETHVSWYIHGERNGEVTVVWRKHVEELMKSVADEDENATNDTSLRAYFDALPIARKETLSMSTRAARAFLRKNAATAISDASEDESFDANVKVDRRAIIVRNNETIFIGDSGQIQSGDTLVVPSAYGWCDEFGLFPGYDKESVTDASELEDDDANRTGWHLELPEQNEDEDETELAWTRRCTAMIIKEFAGSDDPAKQKFAQTMRDAAKIIIKALPFAGTSAKFVVRCVAKFGCNQDDDSGANLQVRLNDHGRHVAEYARAYATALQMPQYLIDTLKTGGLLHDLGKADERFQRLCLDNPDPSQPLAKSASGKSGVPLAYRHESTSAKMVFDEAPMVRHIVGTHHGYGRPGFPYRTNDGSPVSVTIDDERTFEGSSNQDLDQYGSWWRDQFATLTETHTPWGIAYLEAILRLADHRASDDERHQKDNA